MAYSLTQWVTSGPQVSCVRWKYETRYIFNCLALCKGSWICKLGTSLAVMSEIWFLKKMISLFWNLISEIWCLRLLRYSPRCPDEGIQHRMESSTPQSWHLVQSLNSQQRIYVFHVSKGWFGFMTVGKKLKGYSILQDLISPVLYRNSSFGHKLCARYVQ